MPEGIICVWISSQVGLSFVSSVVIPCIWSSISNSSARRGFRISRPTIIAFLPRRAKLMARLAAVNVFPSPEVEDVNIITFSSCFSINCRLVRILLKISSIRLFLFSCTTISALVLADSLATGISPRIGSFVSRTTS